MEEETSVLDEALLELQLQRELDAVLAAPWDPTNERNEVQDCSWDFRDGNFPGFLEGAAPSLYSSGGPPSSAPNKGPPSHTASAAFSISPETEEEVDPDLLHKCLLRQLCEEQFGAAEAAAAIAREIGETLETMKRQTATAREFTSRNVPEKSSELPAEADSNIGHHTEQKEQQDQHLHQEQTREEQGKQHKQACSNVQPIESRVELPLQSPGAKETRLPAAPGTETHLPFQEHPRPKYDGIASPPEGPALVAPQAELHMALENQQQLPRQTKEEATASSSGAPPYKTECPTEVPPAARGEVVLFGTAAEEAEALRRFVMLGRDTGSSEELRQADEEMQQLHSKLLALERQAKLREQQKQAARLTEREEQRQYEQRRLQQQQHHRTQQQLGRQRDERRRSQLYAQLGVDPSTPYHALSVAAMTAATRIPAATCPKSAGAPAAPPLADALAPQQQMRDQSQPEAAPPLTKSAPSEALPLPPATVKVFLPEAKGPAGPCRGQERLRGPSGAPATSSKGQRGVGGGAAATGIRFVGAFCCLWVHPT